MLWTKHNNKTASILKNNLDIWIVYSYPTYLRLTFNLYTELDQ